VDSGFWPAGVQPRSPLPSLARGPLNTWAEDAGHGEVQAIDPRTGIKKWTFKMNDVTDSGILTAATDTLFTGNRECYFFAMDARDGNLLWKATLGGQVGASPIT
jgi:outer membrane protein assembly factor BamB